MKSSLRIGMISARYYPVEGGAEKQCRRLVQELRHQGHDVFVLTQRLPGLPTTETFEGTAVYRVGLPLAGLAGSFSYIISGFLWLLRNRNRYTILHAYLASSPAVLAGLAALAFRIPALVKIAGSRKTGDVSTSRRTWYGKLKLRFLRATIPSLVCPSSEIQDELLKEGFAADRISVIPNGVDVNVFKPADADEKNALRSALGLPRDIPVVLYAGRLNAGKGIENLLDSWRAIERINAAPACLVLLGSGPLEESLKRRAASLASCFFAGWQENVAGYMRASDLFVLPSLGEGMPNSLLEAMSCGLACVATRIGGVTDVITPELNGILTAPGDPDDLSHAIAAALNDTARSRRIGASARASMLKDYSMGAVSGKYLELYRRLDGING